MRNQSHQVTIALRRLDDRVKAVQATAREYLRVQPQWRLGDLLERLQHNTGQPLEIVSRALANLLVTSEFSMKAHVVTSTDLGHPNIPCDCGQTAHPAS